VKNIIPTRPKVVKLDQLVSSFIQPEATKTSL